MLLLETCNHADILELAMRKFKFTNQYNSITNIFIQDFNTGQHQGARKERHINHKYTLPLGWYK